MGGGEKVIASHVGVKLLPGNFSTMLDEGGDDGDGTELGWFARTTGYLDGVSKGIIPALGNITGCET